MLKSLRRVFIQFSPLDPKAKSARELLQRVGNNVSRSSNPDCEVSYQVQEDETVGSSFVELQFLDNQTIKLYTAEMKLDDIVKMIKQKTTEMEVQSVFKEVGFDPFAAAAKKLSKSAGAATGSSTSSTKAS